jgi:hypothetical protein
MHGQKLDHLFKVAINNNNLNDQRQHNNGLKK